MSIKSEIQRIQNNVQGSLNAVADFGVDVPANANSNDLAILIAAIREIESIEQTTISTEDGGDNVLTFTLTNGTVATLTVKNGTKGTKGDTGNNGLSIYSTIRSPEVNPEGYLVFSNIDDISIPDNRTLQVGDLLLSSGYLYEVTAIDSLGDIFIKLICNINGPEGPKGERGLSIIRVTTTPSIYTTAIGDYVPKYRIALSDVKSQGGVDKVIIGDIVTQSYYLYCIDYIDDAYAYISGARVSIRGSAGSAGKTAFAYAQEGGYTGTEEEFAAKMAAEIPTKTSQLTNDSNFATKSEIPSVPVKSVNGKTGAVSLVASDVGAVPVTNALTVTGKDANGTTHTWTMYGVKN